MRALALVVALAFAAPAFAADYPRMRCASCSLLPAGATGSNLSLTGPLDLSGGASTGFAIGLVPYSNNGTNSTGICFEGAAASSCANAFISYNSNTGDFALKAGLGANGFKFISPFGAATEGLHVVVGPDTYFMESGVNMQAFANTSKIWEANGASGELDVPAGPLFVRTGSASFVTQAGFVGSDISNQTTDVGNVGVSGPDDLMTYPVAASTLAGNNRCVRMKAWGTTANNANAKTISVVWGSQTLLTKALAASIAGTWDAAMYCCRTASGAQDCYAEANNNGGTTVSSTDGATVLRQTARVAGTQTDTAGITVKMQTTASTSNNDIVQDAMVVEYF